MGDQTTQKSAEINDSDLGLNQEKRPDEQHVDNRDLKAVKEGVAGAVNLEESVDTTGEIAETAKESHEIKSDSATSGGVQQSSQQAATTFSAAQIRASLIAKMPTEAIMRAQIKQEIEKEIKYLHKKAMGMLRAKNDMSYFAVANLMRKIRELKGILAMLAKTSMDGLKNLWLRFVHGMM